MIVVERDLDFDILIDPMIEIPAARRKALREKYPSLQFAYDEIFKKPVILEAIAEPTGRKAVLRYFRSGDLTQARHVKGEIKDCVIYLDFYGYWKDKFGFWKCFENTHTDSQYNQNPIRDRYDAQNKVAIYSTWHLPKDLANYFEVDKFYFKTSGNNYVLKDSD